MGLRRYALAFGLGYTLGRPDGRHRLTALAQQTLELTRRPEVKRLRKRGRDLAVDSVRAARKKLPATSRASDGDGQPHGDRSWRRPASAGTSPAAAESGEEPASRTPTTR